MSVPAASMDRWVVSTRAYGEVLTAEATVLGLDIRLLGLPEGFSPAEVEGWIASLATAALEGAAAAIPDDPLPPPVRHALGGLLFSHAELWESSRPAPCSMVFMRQHGRIAFGWVGEASVEIYVEGERIAPEWVSVRDHTGGEARAWVGEAGRDTRIELAYACGSGSDAPWCRLEAHWTKPESRPAIDFPLPWDPVAVAESGLESEPSAIGSTTEAFATAESATARHEPELPGRVVSEAQVIRPAEIATRGEEIVESPEAQPSRVSGVGPEAPTRGWEEEAAEPARPSSGVARWLARHLGWGGRRESEFESVEGAEPSDPPAAVRRPDAPLFADDSEVAAEPVAAPVTEAGPAGIAAAMPEAVQPDWSAGIEAPEGMPAHVSERIPPTPEPPSLIARAVRESVPVEDPRAITLSIEPVAAEPFSAAPASEPDPWGLTLESLRGRGASSFGPAEAGTDDGGDVTQAGIRDPIRIETSFPESAQVGASRPGAETPRANSPAAPEWAPIRTRERAAPPRQPEWPTAAPAERPVAWGRWAAWTAFVLLLFGGGWMMGSFQSNDESEGKTSPGMVFLRHIGLGGARFDARVRSVPEGARIVVDGKDTGLRTPATISLTPGRHRLDLAMGNLGSASFNVDGAKGDQVPVDAALWGSVRVEASDPTTAVSVAVDGVPRGFVPITMDSLAPGPHELRFTGPGMASWGSTVEVRVGETKEMLAYPLQSPATGLLQVRATVNEEGDRQPVNGARVWVDGKPRGVTPLNLELPRGPHSVRVAREREEAPIQVIDLPGGNQRFASFEFGLGSEFPKLALRAPQQFPVEEPILISATLTQIPAREVREMWLHVRTPEGTWRRYSMTLLEAQGGAVGAAPFPAALLGPRGATQYYVSAATSQGDEVFTELQAAEAQKRRAVAGRAATTP